MKKNNDIFLKHILDSIVLIERYYKEASQKNVLNKQYFVDAIVRRFEIIGEATKNISKDFKQKHKNIPWRDMGDMRNFLIHEYFDIDEKEVWKTVINDLPDLKKQIRKIL